MRAWRGACWSEARTSFLWALVDAIVDGYFPVFDHSATVDELQDAAIELTHSTGPSSACSRWRELLRFAARSLPDREVFTQLTTATTRSSTTEHVVYFRDVYDHLVRLPDELDNFRELPGGALETYLSTINNTLSTS